MVQGQKKELVIASRTSLILQTEVVDADSDSICDGMLCGACGTFNYMEQRGAKTMKFNDIKFNQTEMPNGIQGMLKFGAYDLSIVKSDFSYGGKSGLYEIAVFKDADQIELPGITEQGDTVKGFLSESEVETIIKKMHLASGADPVVV